MAERDNAYVVTAEMPGVKKEDIHVNIDGSQVTIEAEVKQREAESERAQLHSERVYGSIVRSFTLPQEVDESKARGEVQQRRARAHPPQEDRERRKEISIQ